MDGRRGQQSAFANGNNPPSTTLKYIISRFTAITPPKRGRAGYYPSQKVKGGLLPLPKGEGRDLAKLLWGWGVEDDREHGRGTAGRGRQDFWRFLKCQMANMRCYLCIDTKDRCPRYFLTAGFMCKVRNNIEEV